MEGGWGDMPKGLALAIGLALALAGGPDAYAQSVAPPPITGQRITLDLKGVDILDVLKLLSQKSGLNFVAGRNVSGRVTIFVNDVDVWDAFELIIAANDLAYERQDDIITVMQARDYELIYGEKFQARTQTSVHPLRYAKVVQVATVMNQIKSAVGRVVADEATNTLILTDVPSQLAQMQELLRQLDRQTETRVYGLSYADAEKLREKVQELLSPLGTFTFDARTNKAVVSDLRDVLDRVDQVMRAFDTPDGQVLIEAKIVKVDLTNEMSLGIDWTQIFSNDLTTRGNFRVLSDIVGASTPATGAAMKLFTGPDDKIQIILEALNKVTKTETLSNPRIMVSNNQEARILVGSKEAIVTVTTTVPSTGSTVSSPEIQFVDVGTKLFVTPNIKRDGHIQMKVRPEVSSSKTSTPITNVSVPIVTTTEAETNVLVKSGVTLIIGGLIEDKIDHTTSQIPVLGNLPLLGRLFKSEKQTKTKSEIVVFLTPRIILPDGSAFVEPAEPGPLLSGGERVTVPPAYREVIRATLQAAIASELRAASAPRGSVTVAFVVDRGGSVVGEPALTSPEGPALAAAARRALGHVVPFPPFPPGVSATQLRFRLTVEYAP